ncbi:MAG: HEAT repeat domain-containing protein [Planctomycetaceae bacterium]
MTDDELRRFVEQINASEIAAKARLAEAQQRLLESVLKKLRRTFATIAEVEQLRVDSDFVISKLTDSSSDVRYAALIALAYLHQPTESAMKAVWEVARHESIQEVREFAIMALWKCSVRPPPEELVSYFIMLKDDSSLSDTAREYVGDVIARLGNRS